MADRYAESLARHGLEDVQPTYRKLLRALKSRDAAAYEEAVARYREDVETGTAEADDPVSAWLAYGRWLAQRLAPGRLMVVSKLGRATTAHDETTPGAMLVHLPDDTKRRAILVAMPAEASPAQRETASLLCE